MKKYFLDVESSLSPTGHKFVVSISTEKGEVLTAQQALDGFMTALEEVYEVVPSVGVPYYAKVH